MTTAAADTSFAARARSLNAGLANVTAFSMAVFTASRMSTSAIVSAMASHSTRSRPIHRPATTTSAPAASSMRKLRCVRMRCASPANANANDRTRPTLGV